MLPGQKAPAKNKKNKMVHRQRIATRDVIKTRESETKTRQAETETKTMEAETKTKTKTSRVETKTKTKTSKSGLDRSRDQDQVSRCTQCCCINQVRVRNC